MNQSSDADTNSQPATGYKRKLSALLTLIVLITPVVVVSILINTQYGSRWLFSQLSQYLPLQAQVSGSIGHGLTLKRVRYDLDTVTIQARQIGLDLNLMTLLNAELTIKSLIIDQPVITLIPQPETDNEPPTLPVIRLPIAIDLQQLQIRQLVVNNPDQTLVTVNQVDTVASWRGTQLTVPQLAINAPQGQVAATASVDWRLPYSITLDADWQLRAQQFGDQQPALAGQLKLADTLDQLSIHHKLTRPDAVTTEGLLAIVTDQQGRVEQTLIELDNRWQQIQGFKPVNEWLAINDGHLHIDTNLTDVDINLDTQLVFKHTPTSDTTTDAIPARLELSGNGNRQAVSIGRLALTTQTRPAQTVVITGQAENADQWSWQAQANVSRFNPGLFAAGFPGQLDAKLSSRGKIRLAQDDQPQQLNARVQVQQLQGQLRKQPVAATADIRLDNNRLQRAVADLSLGSNRININTTETNLLTWQAEINDLKPLIPSVSATLTSQGQIDRNGVILMEADTQQLLDNLLITTQTQITDLIITSEASEDLQLTFADVSIEPAEGRHAVDITIDQLTAGTSLIRQGQLAGLIGFEQQDVSLDLRSDTYGQLRVRLDGELDGTQWSGNIDRFALDSPQLKQWQLNQDAQLTVTPRYFTLNNLCLLPVQSPIAQSDETTSTELSGDSSSSDASDTVSDSTLAQLSATSLKVYDDTAICLNSTIDNPDSQTPTQMIDARVTALSLNLFNAFLPASAQLEGLLNLTADARLQNYQPQTVDINLDIPPGQLKAQDETELTFNWSTWNANASLADQQWQIGSQAVFEAAGQYDLSLTVNQASGNLEGQIEADFIDLSMAEVLTNQIRDVDGQLNADIKLAGTMADPLFSGQIRLIEAGVFLPDPGLRLEQLNAEVRTENRELLILSASSRTAQGALNFEGEFQRLLEDDWLLQGEVTGQNYRLFDRADRRVDISPDIQIRLNAELARITGQLTIPEAYIELEDTPPSAVKISEDVIVTGLDSTLEQTAGTEVDIDLTVILGNNIQFEGLGLEMQLGGDLRLRQTPERPLQAFGELDIISGRYQGYGQLLKTENGLLIFSGPLDNPAINLRASRQVDDVVVGLDIGGTVNNPSTAVFSNPNLPDGEALSLLLTGRRTDGTRTGGNTSAVTAAIASLGINGTGSIFDTLEDKWGLDEFQIDADSGVGNSALTIGKYLSPRLFVRYAIGVFDNTSKLIMNYEINRRLDLRAESGLDRSVDLIYSVTQ